MYIGAINPISFTAKDSDKKRKVNQTDVAVVGGGGFTATKAMMKKTAIATKNLDAGSRYVNRVAAEVPKISTKPGANPATYVKRFSEWVGSSKIMKPLEPILKNPAVKKIGALGGGVCATLFTINELGQMFVTGENTYREIINNSKNAA